MSSIAPKPTVEGPQPPLGSTVRIQDMHLSPRRRKESLLPQITQLALEGHSGRSIGRTLGLSKRTVNHWLQKLRQEWIAKAAQSGAEMCAVDLERLDAIYRAAMEAWRNSQTQPQRGSAALLARATAAVTASWRLKGCPAPPRAPRPAPVPAETRPQDGGQQLPEPGSPAWDRRWLGFLMPEHLQEMTYDDLREVEARLQNVIEAEGGALPAELENRDLEHMTGDELRAYRDRLMDAVLAIEDGEDSPDTECSPADPPLAPVGPDQS
jgi:hypothetical protein